MTAPKFLIVNGQLVMNVVEFHNELLRGYPKDAKVLGGGRYLRSSDGDKKYILFYGSSDEFKSISRSAFEKYILTDEAFKESTLLFSEKEWASDAIKEANAIVGDKIWR
jgi:hypothetical protein